MEYDEKTCRERLCDLAGLMGVPESKLPAFARLADGIVLDVHAPDAVDKMRVEINRILEDVPELKMRKPSSWR